MRAVVISEPGGPEVLELREVPDPTPGPEELVVDVVATALNRADLLQRMGRYPGPRMEFEIPGLEFSGHVVGMGERVDGWSIGDPVMGIVSGGAYAEKLVLHHRQALPIPPSIEVAEAAAIPEAFLTAFDALVVQGAMTSGRRALVHAGGSGVGTAATQIVKAIGGFVAVTCSTGKVQGCRELGADLVVDYKTEDFGELVREWAPDGVDVVLDVIGAEYLNRNLDVLRVGGTLIQVGVMGQSRAELDLSRLLPKRAHIVGTVLRARPIEEKIELVQRFRSELLGLFATGALSPIVRSRFTLGDIVNAHRTMEANMNFGKILVTVHPSG